MRLPGNRIPGVFYWVDILKIAQNLDISVNLEDIKKRKTIRDARAGGEKCRQQENERAICYSKESQEVKRNFEKEGM